MFSKLKLHYPNCSCYTNFTKVKKDIVCKKFFVVSGIYMEVSFPYRHWNNDYTIIFCLANETTDRLHQITGGLRMSYNHGTQEWEDAYVKLTGERMDTNPKPYVYFMPEWVGAWEKFLKADPVYKSVALPDWRGAVVLHVLKSPDYGVDQDIYVYLDLHANEVRSIRIVPATYGKQGAFVITGTIERWMAVGKKELDVVKGMMQGKLKLKGNLPAIVRAIKPAVRLVDAAAEVGGLMPDEWTPERIEEIRGTIKDLTTKFNID